MPVLFFKLYTVKKVGDENNVSFLLLTHSLLYDQTGTRH